MYLTVRCSLLASTRLYRYRYQVRYDRYDRYELLHVRYGTDGIIRYI